MQEFKTNLYYWLMAVPCHLVKKNISFCFRLSCEQWGHKLCQSLRGTCAWKSTLPRLLEVSTSLSTASSWKARDHVWLIHYYVTRVWHIWWFVNIPLKCEGLSLSCNALASFLSVSLDAHLSPSCRKPPGSHWPEGSVLSFWRLWRVLTLVAKQQLWSWAELHWIPSSTTY